LRPYCLISSNNKSFLHVSKFSKSTLYKVGKSSTSSESVSKSFTPDTAISISLRSNAVPLALEPYDYAIASCNEKISMPRDVSGRFDVSVNLFCQGIILSNSTQVDPGFRGKLFCLLFNTSNKVVYLKRHTHFATMEFNKLIEPTTPYSGKYADEDSIVPYLPTNVMQGAINELKKEIENLKTENQKMQGIYLSVLALFLAIVSIFLTLK